MCLARAKHGGAIRVEVHLTSRPAGRRGVSPSIRNDPRRPSCLIPSVMANLWANRLVTDGASGQS